MTPVDRRDEEDARLTREITARAIKRLDVLEWVILAGAGGMAVLGGALVAWLLADPLGLAFRPTWLVASLVLFGVPGAIALRRIKKEERDWLEQITNDGTDRRDG